MPEPEERLGEIANVRLHPSRDVPRVRADDADPQLSHPSCASNPHQGPGLPPARRPAPGRIQVREPESLQHMPVARMRGDVRGEGVRQRLGAASRPAPASGAAREGRRAARCAAPQPPSAGEPQADRQERRAGRGRQQCRSGGHPGRRPEELDRHSGAGQVAVGDEAHALTRYATGRPGSRRPAAARRSARRPASRCPLGTRRTGRTATPAGVARPRW